MPIVMLQWKLGKLDLAVYKTFLMILYKTNRILRHV